ncbi:MAG TPA: sugar ABC transporter substrate-binding protein [Mycobacteriales bacterium]
MPGRTATSQYSRRDLLRIGGSVAAVGAAAPVLASCSRAPSTSSSGGGSKTFTMYWNSGHAYDTYNNVVSKFEKDHGVTVNWQKFQWPDLQTKLQADISAGTPPDLVEQPGGDTAIPLALTGDLMPLDAHIAKDGAAMGFPGDWQNASVMPWQHAGNTYGVQIHLTCSQLYYNKKMLAAAGVKPPATWDDLLAVGKKLTSGHRYAIALNQDPGYSVPWLQQNGVSEYDDATKQLLTPHPATIEALQFQHDLIYKYKYSPAPVPSSDYSGPQKLLSAQRAAMIITGPWDILPIRQAGGVDLGIAPPLMHKERKTILAGSGLIIPAKAKNRDLAWDLIKRLTTLEVELAVTKEAGQTMPRKSWTTQAPVKGDPLIGAVAQALPSGADWGQKLAATGKGPQVDDAYQTLYQSVAISGKTPQGPMSDFLATADKVVR